MKTIAICNQKGGVAKTTSAINISAYLALKGKRTLLIDLDPQANATSGLGINKGQLQYSIYNVLHEQAKLEQVIRDTEIELLSVAPSNINLTGAEVELVSAIGREHKLRKAIQEMSGKYDFVIIDCPPSLGLLTVNALTAADSVIVPIQCEYYALEGLGQLMKTIKLITENLNGQLVVEGVLMTMADLRANLTKEVIEEVKKFFGGKVYKTIIPRTIKLTEAPGFGKPIALYDGRSLGAKKYESVVDEILGINKVEPPSDNENAQPIVTKEVITEEAHGKEIR